MDKTSVHQIEIYILCDLNDNDINEHDKTQESCIILL